MTRSFTLITGRDCHLCEHGRQVLAAVFAAAPYTAQVREIDAQSDEAAGLAGRGVPVVVLPVLVEDGTAIAYGRFSEKRLRRDLG